MRSPDAPSAGVPLATRTMRIGPLRIEYDHRVLEPRPWTAEHARWATERTASAPPGPILEICSGAGHIGLLAATLSGRAAILIDVSPPACDFARANAEAAGLAARVQVRCAEMTSALGPEERFPVVLADPPYIPTAVVPDFPEDPVSAIDGGEDGLDVARTCLAVGADHLLPGGGLFLQLRDRAQLRQLVGEVHRRRLAVVDMRTVAHDGLIVQLAHAGTRG